MKKSLSFCFRIVIGIISIILCLSSGKVQASPEWLYYDEGTPENPSSSFPFQGVRFSLPDNVIKAQLLTIRFYFSCAGECPLTLHITRHDHKSELIPPIQYTAKDSWNDVSVAGLNITVPHNFYIILENHTAGSPVIDNETSEKRSFKGQFLESVNTHLSHNLLIRAEIGAPLDVPVVKKWSATVDEQVKYKIQKQKTIKIKNPAYAEQWTLYADGSCAFDNNLFGLWQQKGKKYAIDLDPEDINDLIAERLSDEIEDTIVTKASFTWSEKKNGTMRGQYKFSAGTYFVDYEAVGSVFIQGKITGIPE
jgi:hypothetical protein